MSIRNMPPDRRYTIGHDYCDHTRLRRVARFCGDWLGQAATETAPLAITAAHVALRVTVLEGAPR